MINTKEKCAGCSACLSICPVGAIFMQADEQGFLYPEIDKSKCVDCHKCEQVCFYKTGYETLTPALPQLKAYAGRYQDKEKLAQSRSGGAFTLLAEKVLSAGGVVYGAVLKHDEVHHIRVSKMEELPPLKGSKYTQSILGNIFLAVKQDLTVGERQVLFSGTSCQVAGLQKFLGRPYDNLLLVDIVCHGVPSPKLFREYIAFMEKRYGSVADFYFRDKWLGWSGHMESFRTLWKNRHFDEIFTKLFYSHCCLRPSCYGCAFTNLKRPSDITLADCWGIADHEPELFDDKGMSLIIVSTAKGENVLSDAERHNFFLKEVDIRDYMQPQLRHPAEKPAEQEEFWNLYKEQGFGAVAKKFGQDSYKNRIKKWKFNQKMRLKACLQRQGLWKR